MELGRFNRTGKPWSVGIFNCSDLILPRNLVLQRLQVFKNHPTYDRASVLAQQTLDSTEPVLRFSWLFFFLHIFKHKVKRIFSVSQVPFQKVCRQNDTCIAELKVDFNFVYVHLTNVEQQFLIFPLAMRRNAKSTLFLSGPQHYWWKRIATSTYQLNCLIKAMTRTTPAFRCTILRACPSLVWLWQRWLKTQLPYHFTSTSLHHTSLIWETQWILNIQVWSHLQIGEKGWQKPFVASTETQLWSLALFN